MQQPPLTPAARATSHAGVVRIRAPRSSGAATPRARGSGRARGVQPSTIRARASSEARSRSSSFQASHEPDLVMALAEDWRRSAQGLHVPRGRCACSRSPPGGDPLRAARGVPRLFDPAPSRAARRAALRRRDEAHPRDRGSPPRRSAAARRTPDKSRRPARGPRPRRSSRRRRDRPQPQPQLPDLDLPADPKRADRSRSPRAFLRQAALGANDRACYSCHLTRTAPAARIRSRSGPATRSSRATRRCSGTSPITGRSTGTPRGHARGTGQGRVERRQHGRPASKDADTPEKITAVLDRRPPRSRRSLATRTVRRGVPGRRDQGRARQPRGADYMRT